MKEVAGSSETSARLDGVISEYRKLCSFGLFRVNLSLLRWVHTCNFTPYRNAVTLQVTDKLQSYVLKFHPVPHGVTVYCERYTVGFPVCYGSQKHHECKEGERSGRW
jgi:hypothetical protein